MNTMTHESPETPEAAAPVRRIDQLLSHYGICHTNPTNELIHYIAVPAIVLSVVGMFYSLHPYVAYVCIAASLVYYARLSMVFLVSMAVMLGVMLWAVQLVGPQLFWVSLAIFVVAWIFQFIGHKVEGKKPSFFEDLQYLLIGPLFVLSHLFRKLGIRW